MTPVESLKLIVPELSKLRCQFAVCGGIAASIYRTTPRLTNDVDIAIAGADRENGERELAVQFLEGLGFSVLLGWFPGANRSDQSSVFAVVGARAGFLPTVDLLLPSLPWVRQSVSRAQANVIDYGFGRVPTITPEDLVISKVYALSIDPVRLNDRADIDSILESGIIADVSSLEKSLEELGLKMPAAT